MIRVVCPLLIGGIFVATTIDDIVALRAAKDPEWGPYIGQWCLLGVLFLISLVLMFYRRNAKEEVSDR
jgi:hypothetical protein